MPPIGPDHFQAVHALCSTEPEVLAVVHCGHVPPVGRMVEILLLSSRRQDQLRADPPSVGGLPVEPDLQIVMDVVIGLDVLVDRGRRVDVIDHEVELAVVIEICIRSEEHTSELQSRLHLVCRLLLEKKKKARNLTHAPHHTSSLSNTQ